MGANRNDRRRAGRRAFRPQLDGVLESRFLLSRGVVSAKLAPPTAAIQSFTFNGGKGVRVENSAGEFFDIHVTGPGVVRAFPMSGGRALIRVDGTAADSVLSIDPAKIPPYVGGAHRFSFGQTTHNQILQVGGIQVTSGVISQILAYRTADLSGPVVVGGTGAVDRIAFNNLLPGASIGTGGDLNTLDVLNNVTLDSGQGIFAGRDLNWFNIGGNVTLTNGASLFASRYIGLTAQGAKGTDPGGVGGVIGGNLDVEAPSGFAAGTFIVNPVIVEGSFINATQSRIVNGAGKVIAFGPTIIFV